jgi:hypothetical protein
MNAHKVGSASGRAVDGVGLRPLCCWDRGFESRSGMDVCLLCLYVVLSCVGRGLCDGLITRPEDSYRVSCMCDHRNPERDPMFQMGTAGKMMMMKVGSASLQSLRSAQMSVACN